MASSMKTYQVEYLISMNDQVSGVLTTLAENAKALEAPLANVQKYIRDVQAALNALRSGAAGDLVIKPTLDTNTVKEQFATLEREASQSAAIIAKMMNKAMMGINPKTNLAGDATKEGIKKQIEANEKAIAVSTEKVAKKLREQNQQLKKDMKYAASASKAPTDIATAFSNLAKSSDKLTIAGKAIGNIGKNLSKLDTSKQYVIKVDADISPAVRKINTLLETVRTNVAALPITVADASKKAVAGTKGGDAISAKTGQATKTGKANVAVANAGKVSSVEKALKGKKAIANLTPQFDGNTMVTQLIQTVEKLQTTAKEKPITIRSTFDGVEAAYQFHMTVHRLQELANEKPIVLKSVLSSTGANPGTNNTAVVNSSTGNNGTAPVVTTEKVGRFGITQKEERFWERHQKQMYDMNTANRVDMITMEAKRRAEQTEAFRKDIESRIGRSALHQQWVNNDKLGLSTRAKNIEARKQAEAARKQAIAEKAANIKAYEEHAAAMANMRIENDGAYSKLERKYAAQQHAARQADLNSVLSRDALHQQWVNNDKLGLSTRAKNIEKAANIKAYEEHAAAMANMRADNDAAYSKLESKYAAQQHAARQADVNSVFSRDALHQQWINNDKLGLSTRAKNIAARKQREAAIAETNANIKAYEEHAATMSKMRAENDAAYSKLERKYAAQQKAARQADLNAVFGRDALHQQWVARDKAGESTRARNNAARIAEEAQIARLNAQRAMYQGWVEQPVVAGGIRVRGGRGSSGYRGVAAPTSLYSRARNFWYPFTGNTSFGAQTPMAVSMAKGMGSMMAIGGAMSAISSSLHQSVVYQNMMKTTQAILENGTKTYSESGFREMEQTVRQVGKETKFTAPQVASAAKFLAMAGYDIPAIKSAINPVANIALIGDTNLGETADKLTNVMTTFGIAPEKMNDIADIMTSTFTRSNTDMMMLAESAKYAGGIAHLYGGNFDNNFADVMAMFGALGNAGIQASSAGTTLRMMYQNLMQPNKNQKATLKKYGINPRDSNGRPLEMVDILKQIMNKVPANKLADAVGTMFRITAQPGAAALVESLRSGKLVDLMEANRNAAGTGVAQTIADEKKNTLAGLWSQVSSAFTEAVLQAVEGRQGGWAGMLGQLRDYLSKPETIQALSSIVDLVERLMSMFADFAKIWTKIYSILPGFINGWIHIQMVMTQFGYLVTPVIQLISILDRLKTSLIGITGASAAASVVSRGGGLAMNGGVMLSAMSGVPRYVRNRDSAARYAAYAATLGILGERKATLDSKAAYLKNPYFYANREKTFVSPFWTMPMGAFGTVGGEEKFFEERSKYAKYEGQIASRARTATAAQNEAKRIQDEINALKNDRFNTLRAMRRPEQTANRALMARYAAIVDRSVAANNATAASNAALALISTANSGFAARDAKIAEAAQMRHAARRGVESDVRKRFLSRYGFGRTANLSFASNFRAGRLAGTFNWAAIFLNLKNMVLGLFGTIARGLGLLLSPAGLAVTALTAVSVALYIHYKRMREYQKQMERNAKEYAETSAKARKNDLKPGLKLHESITNSIWGGKAPVIKASSTQSNMSKQRNAIAETKAKYKDVLNEDQDASEANRLWFGTILSSAPGRLGFYDKNNDIIGNKNGLHTVNVEKVRWEFLDSKGYKRERNEKAAHMRAVRTLQYRGAIAESTINARDKIVELYQQYKAGKIDQKTYQNEASKLLPNTKASGLLDAFKYTNQQIGNSDPTRFQQYQIGAYNAIYAEIHGLMGSLTGQLAAAEQLKGGVAAYSDKWYNAVAHLINGTQTTIQTIKGDIQATLTALPNGQIDTQSLLAQIRAKVAGFKLTIMQFANLVAGAYAELVKGGFVSGKYYSDYIKFTKAQTAHKVVTAEDAGAFFDTYIAKGDANAKWGNLDREQYIKWVTNQKDHGRAANEREIIRGAIASNAAITMKKQTDAALKQMGAAGDNNNTGGNGGGKGGSNNSTSDDDSAKKQKDYANTYDRNAARPTQVIINIDSLAKFDGTTIAKNADDRAIASAIEYKIAEAINMLSAQALNAASSTISQGLS